MPKGKIPRPSKLQVELRGDPSKRRRKTIEPDPPKGAPDCPQHVQDDPIAHAEGNPSASNLTAWTFSAGLTAVPSNCTLRHILATSTPKSKSNDTRTFFLLKKKYSHAAGFVPKRMAVMRCALVLLPQANLGAQSPYVRSATQKNACGRRCRLESIFRDQLR